MSSPVEERDGFVAAPDNVRLYWQSRRPERPAATVLLVHGYGDHVGRYRHVFDRLAGAGFEVVGFDYRGHGQADGRRGHCDRFADYLGDLDTLVARVRGEAGGRPLFLLGHSQGGLIAARWLLEGRDGVAGAIFASPYLRLALEPSRLKVAAARLAGKAIPWLPVQTGITSGDLTRDPEMQAAVDRDPLYNRTATPRWFEEAALAQEEVRARAGELRLPSLVLVATADPVADPAEMRRFFGAVASADKSLIEYEGAHHELLNELPAVRGKALDDVVAWLRARAGAPAGSTA